MCVCVSVWKKLFVSYFVRCVQTFACAWGKLPLSARGRGNSRSGDSGRFSTWAKRCVSGLFHLYLYRFPHVDNNIYVTKYLYVWVRYFECDITFREVRDIVLFILQSIFKLCSLGGGVWISYPYKYFPNPFKWWETFNDKKFSLYFKNFHLSKTPRNHLLFTITTLLGNSNRFELS